MRERLTARLLLFDPAARLLLMKARLVAEDGGRGAWFPVGGGAEPGESVMQAAAREVFEETGFADVALGPVVWRRDVVLTLVGREPALFREHYIVASCAGGEPRRDGWEAHEQSFVDDIRWWTLEEIRASCEPIYPEGLADLLPEVIAGRHPAQPITIR